MVAGVLLFWLLPRPTEKNQPPSTAAAKVTARPAPSPPAPRKSEPAPTPSPGVRAPTLVNRPPTAISGTQPTPANPEAQHKPPEGAVPYTYTNGWVIAYGDILLGKPKDPGFPANGFIEAPKLNFWPRGVVPFSVHESLPNPDRVLRVVAYMNENTPVRFIPYDGQADSIVFFPMEGVCVSYLGKIGGNQPIYLDTRCSDHEIIHELMHALGFIHEHSRSDRDQYVAVQWNHIEPDKVDQFDVSPPSLNEPLKGRPFDYTSVMLYSSTAFARNPGDPTLLSRSEAQAIAPVNTGLSVEDLERVRLLYGR